ncbi:hypothetical protein ASD65_09405 [Microbacterium sp. Root61]|uniref:NAD(P)/FAD-dependent oxidoreductase n=1 Tax=Microbacterium sp. Root61 TaxID=1736570 RepID=UPI0006F2EE11|nr:FAD/NAD(P)-binding oxidoreductase [Microbacterium sp. Root61]KRA24600.1 hypothetical protein ASD65_09405 [Microbacterium sp. Root61]
MTTARVGAVIVGASIGGLTAAETLREEGFDGHIMLLGDEPHLPYNRPPLSKQVLLGEWESDDAAIRTAAELGSLDVEVRTSCPATGLDVDDRVLHTASGPIAFDELIIATGTEPHRHPDLPDAHGLRTIDEALRLRDAFRNADRVAIIGSGILGSEIASAARHFGAQTLLVGRSGTLSFGGVGTLLSEQLAQLHREHDVELALNAAIERAVALPDGTEIAFTDGTSRRFDLVVSMIGGAPRTRWLAGSSLTIADGIVCDSVGRAAPGISAVGDVAAWQDPHTRRSIRVEHQSNAIEQAIAVACRIVGGESLPQPTPLFWSEIHKTRINAYGWFDSRGSLVPDDATADGSVYTSSSDGAVRGVVGWNASPRAFRQARALIPAPAPSLAA